MVWHSELPKVNLYSWFVNEAASKHVKVCLSGLGGDELFAGYPSTSRFQLARRIARYRGVGKFLLSTGLVALLPKRMRALARSLRSETDAYSAVITGFPSDEVNEHVKTKISTYFDGDDRFVQKMVRAEFHTKLPYDYLLVEDAMSMAHTLEVRVPLLDDLLVDSMLAVPYAANLRAEEGKRLLREAVADVLPARCMQKPKWGFSVDVYSWWKKGVREYATKFVPESKFLKTIAPEWHEKVSRRIALPTDPGNTRWYQMAWIMLGMDVWARMFLEADSPRVLSW
jgi:asparagine synthase (glutamine-hydrolysing)